MSEFCKSACAELAVVRRINKAAQILYSNIALSSALTVVTSSANHLGDRYILIKVTSLILVYLLSLT